MSHLYLRVFASDRWVARPSGILTLKEPIGPTFDGVPIIYDPPPEGPRQGPSIRFAVQLRRVVDGKTITIPSDHFDDESADYYWREGNGSCDCNRSMQFGVPIDEAEYGDGGYELVMLVRAN